MDAIRQKGSSIRSGSHPNHHGILFPISNLTAADPNERAIICPTKAAIDGSDDIDSEIHRSTVESSVGHETQSRQQIGWPVTIRRHSGQNYAVRKQQVVRSNITISAVHTLM
ncbi:hypothetical protein ACLOJK_038808 [Asimina triloba]